MRTVGRRKKKLITAFQFQFANQAAWGCGDCRKQGLERQRGCRFTDGGRHRETDVQPIVWARRNAVIRGCPKVVIRPESLKWLEEFAVWKAGGAMNLMRLPARTAEAFLVLEQELRAEQKYARQDNE